MKRPGLRAAAPLRGRPRRIRRPSLTPRGYAVLAALGVLLLVILVLGFRSCALSPRLRVISLRDFQSFRMPSGAVERIYELSEKYSVSFPKLLTVYGIDNSFFPESQESYVYADEIEQNYLLNYSELEDEYGYREYDEYFRIVAALVSDIKTFPVDKGFGGDDYMFGDSFGAERVNGSDELHKGCDITDRMNSRGRIDLISATDGRVTASGWDDVNGWYLQIESSNFVNYHYYHLQEIRPGIENGDIITAGQTLGSMGDSGYSRSSSDYGYFPVHLHFGISLKTSLYGEDIYINPYYILKFAEWKGRLGGTVS